MRSCPCSRRAGARRFSARSQRGRIRSRCTGPRVATAPAAPWPREAPRSVVHSQREVAPPRRRDRALARHPRRPPSRSQSVDHRRRCSGQLASVDHQVGRRGNLRSISLGPRRRLAGAVGARLERTTPAPASGPRIKRTPSRSRSSRQASGYRCSGLARTSVTGPGSSARRLAGPLPHRADELAHQQRREVHDRRGLAVVAALDLVDPSIASARSGSQARPSSR